MRETVQSKGSRMRAYLELMRPANIVTALADVLAGFAASGAVSLLGMRTGADLLPSLAWLLFSTAALYGGGVVLSQGVAEEIDSGDHVTPSAGATSENGHDNCRTRAPAST